MIYDDTDLISKFTSANLNFSSEKYHLGCILVCDYRVRDRCISKLTVDSKTTFEQKPTKRKCENDKY
jgi:hypothetical protein